MSARSIHRNESRGIQVGKCKAVLRFSACVKCVFRSFLWKCGLFPPFFLKFLFSNDCLRAPLLALWCSGQWSPSLRRGWIMPKRSLVSVLYRKQRSLEVWKWNKYSLAERGFVPGWVLGAFSPPTAHRDELLDYGLYFHRLNFIYLVLIIVKCRKMSRLRVFFSPLLDKDMLY